MDRPTLPKYVTRSNYTIELEKYCDELERALDNACQILVNMKSACDCYEFETCPFREICSEDTNYCGDKEKWEEYLLKDE